MTHKERIKLMRLIRTYTNAELDDSWKGGGDPADFPAIEKRLRDAKRKLRGFLDELEEKANAYDREE